MHRATSLGLTALLLTGCNRYDYFRVSGYQQESFSNQADILFVIDNSPSMTQEGPALASNFAEFIEQFAGNEIVPTDPTLSDDVDRFISYVTDRSGNINYNLAVTTTEPSADWGSLYGQPKTVSRTDDNIARKFTRNLICEAACIDNLPSDLDVNCTSSPENFANCSDNTTGAAEEGFEAVLMAMCRASESPPDFCFDAWWRNPDNEARNLWLPFDPGLGNGDDTGTPGTPTAPAPYFSEIDVGSNDGWLRENSTVIPVIITDEGDQSRRITSFDGKIFPYNDFFNTFPNRMTWAVIGPTNDGCNTSGAARWGIDRYRTMVNETNGAYIPISVPDGRANCADADFGQALADVGELLRALVDSFPLGAIPVPGTIVVVVDGAVIAESEQTFEEDLGSIVFSDGWSYRPADNTVVLHGDAVPDFNADVRIYYIPGDANPRELPF
jgi:hypothetical protein